MSYEHLQKPCQQRFKRVENFLRRVAFNLGNTASQTEVKIISCIPIDVTDLQQKIISLEKQLHEAQEQGANAAEKSTVNPKNSEKVEEKRKTSDKTATIVNTALYSTACAKQSSTVSYCSNKPASKIKSGLIVAHCGNCSSRTKRSNVSFVIPTVAETNYNHSCSVDLNKDSDNGNNSTINRCKNIFKTRKRKKFGDKPKLKTHLVYYAHQTADTPFKNNNIRINNLKGLSNIDEMCFSHINNVLRRQYDPNEGIEEFSDTSNFTRPICRETALIKNPCESDVCSCCHGTFQNIDNYMTNNLFCQPIDNTKDRLPNTKLYYDSNNYDIIPVKEKMCNINNEKKTKNNLKVNLKMKCWPENIRAKQSYHPCTVNYEAKIPITQGFKTAKPSQKLKKQNKELEKFNKNILLSVNGNQQTGMETSNSCCIEYGDTYTKMIKNQKHVEPAKTVMQINESVETDTVINKIQGINQSTQLELNPTDDSKVLTLNEIKTALLSVLEEIKTSTKLNVSDKTTKQDVVQKSSSQKNLEGESVLLHSYTYNKSYNTNPYVASCSRQCPHGQYCYGSVPYHPLKFFQNFPVFIQPSPGRHMCACYYRKSSSKPTNRPAATANTNTEHLKSTGNKETEKLIKEIYKSIALNMDYPNKEISSSEYHNPSSSENGSINKNTRKEMKKEVSSRRDIKVEALNSPFQLHADQSTLVYTAASTQSEDNSEVHESHPINFRELNNYKTYRNVELQSTDIINEEKEMSVSSSETESNETVVLEEFKQNVKRRKGFFNRMLKSVKLFKKKKDIHKQQTDIDEASDSDDYETIYSEKSKVPSRQQITQNYLKDKNHGKNKSPYLEQEYRRRWNEYMMLQENSKHSSERPYSKQSISKSNKPVYWTNYEARSAIVHHNGRNNLNPVKIQSTAKNFKQQKVNSNTNEKLGWLKKHRLGANCGEQWKKFILEN